MSTVEVKIHLEPLDGPEIAWWAESDQVPGMSATASHLPELLSLVSEAIADLVAGTPKIKYSLVTEEPSDLRASIPAPATVASREVRPDTSADPVVQRFAPPWHVGAVA